jgi:hypothetical protein
MRSPVGEVALDAEGGDLHGGLYDEDCREEVIEQLQGVLQFLPQKTFTSIAKKTELCCVVLYNLDEIL